LTHINEFSPLIREPTPEHAQNALDTIVPASGVNELLPNIFERLDNHEDSREVASDTLFDVVNITEAQLQDGIDVVFDIGIIERIATMVLNILNSVIQRATEVLI